MALKKIVSLLLALMVLCTMLVGCGASNKEEASSSSQKAEATASEDSSKTDAASTESSDDGTLKVPDKEMKITLWDIATEDPANRIQQGAVDRFMKDHPNVKVETTHIQNDTYKQKLVVAMSSNQCPNMYIHWGGGPMNEYIESGFAVPVTDLMNKYCKVDFLKAAIEQSSYKGEIYAVPYSALAGSGFFYNKTIFEKYGLQVPKTISELEQVCETLKQNGIIPFSLANQSKWTGSMYFMYLVARKSGLDEFNKAVDGTGSFESDAFKYAGETIQKWVKAGYFPEGVNSLSADDGQDRQLMYQEKAAMMLHGTWQASQMSSDNKDWYEKNIDYFAFPTLDGSTADQSIVVGTSIGNGFSFNTGDDEDLLKACFVLATQYYNDDTYIQESLDTGSIPSINGAGDNIQDHCMQKVWKDFTNASSVQLWYDQYLPPEVAEVHKSTSQELFGLTKTPEQANKELQDAMTKYLASKKK
jgi:raffinose/stachyose/melibiose transport system substrate-binding protein